MSLQCLFLNCSSVIVAVSVYPYSKVVYISIAEISVANPSASKLLQTPSVYTYTDFSIFITYFRMRKTGKEGSGKCLHLSADPGISLHSLIASACSITLHKIYCVV